MDLLPVGTRIRLIEVDNLDRTQGLVSGGEYTIRETDSSRPEYLVGAVDPGIFGWVYADQVEPIEEVQT